MPGAIKQWDQKVILQKIEATDGTDAGPAVGTDALKVLNYRPTFMDADGRVRPFEKKHLGGDPTLLSAFRRGASFDMEMHGSGAAATPPPWMAVARIAGFNAGVPTPAAGPTSVVQSPVSDIPSATHWGYLDDLLLKALGCRATMSFRLADDEVPMFSFGLLGRPPQTLAEEAVPGTPTISGYVEPLIASSEVTTFSLDGFALALRSWEMSNNADLSLRSLIGPADRIQMRNRPWAGAVVGRVPSLAAKNYFANIRPGTFMAAQAVHGTTAGNIVQIDTPRLQISGNVDLTEEAGELMITLPVTALPVNGNDELVFTTK